MMAKAILPIYGGSSSVWTNCMLFFQSGLLIGYAYAHFIVRLGSKRALTLQLLLLVCACSVLIWRIFNQLEPSIDSPILSILIHLTFSIGLPYILLSATAPLIQRLVSMSDTKVQVYRLYALSNIASFLALFAYPALVEPRIGISSQFQLWSIGFAIYALSSFICIYNYRAALNKNHMRPKVEQLEILQVLRWLILSLTGVALMLAFTNQLCMNVASVPFLWIVPLSLYLASFILTFGVAQIYNRPLFLFLFTTLALGSYRFIETGAGISFGWLLALASVVLFLGCCILHGELERLKPVPERLTEFYLVLAVGGALGGLSVGVIAPSIFTNFAEFPISLIMVVLISLWLSVNDRFCRSKTHRWTVATFFAVAVLILIGSGDRLNTGSIPIAQGRNFYGVVSIVEKHRSTPNHHFFQMHHGAVVHGLQFQATDLRLMPTTYYGPKSGAGLALSKFHIDQNRNIGIIGLGAGTLATYGLSTDRIIFFEINPLVKSFAKQFFTFLSDTKPKVEIVDGDARLQLKAVPSQLFDILIVDAFSGDSIPLHLITTQAFELYLSKLKNNGMLVLHISNMHIDLVPVVAKLAAHFGLRPFFISDSGELNHAIRPSLYAVVARNIAEPDFIALESFLREPTADLSMTPLWTDDYTPLLSTIKW